MSDIRRSILWVIFGFSLILIWDQWQIYNGHPATFFPSSSAKKAAVTQPAAKDAGVPQAAASAAGASEVPSAAPSIPRQTHVVTTDVLKLTFDSEGGSLVGAQMLKHAAVTGLGKDKPLEPLQLLNQDEKHTYVAQTGLIGGSFPTHKTPMRLVSGGTQLADGQDSLALRFESEPAGGLVLAKTYTVKRGAYDIGVKHEVINRGDAAATPQLYLQLVRDGAKAESETPFYSTFTPGRLQRSLQVPEGEL